MQRPRVVITGVGLRVPGASNLSELLTLYRRGLPATRKLNDELADYSGGAVDATDVNCADGSKLDRSSILGLTAANDALADAGLLGQVDHLKDAGIYVGCGGGGLAAIEHNIIDVYKQTPLKSTALIKSMANAVAAHISMAHGCQGPSLTYAMACSSSAHAVGEAMCALQAGKCNLVIAGGAEAPLTLSLYKSWAALRLLAQDEPALCRPFSYERNGLLLGEGSVFYVLETFEGAQERGAKILCELRGYGARSDASHITAPNAQGQAATILATLRDAELSPADIDHISAHGTATLAGDVSETRAITSVFANHARQIPISATKSFHGHLLGGAGAVSLLASILAVAQSFLAPTINFGTQDPDLTLDYIPNAPREHHAVRASLCNAFGFGGSNASLIVSTMK